MVCVCVCVCVCVWQDHQPYVEVFKPPRIHPTHPPQHVTPTLPNSSSHPPQHVTPTLPNMSPPPSPTCHPTLPNMSPPPSPTCHPTLPNMSPPPSPTHHPILPNSSSHPSSNLIIVPNHCHTEAIVEILGTKRKTLRCTVHKPFAVLYTNPHCPTPPHINPMLPHINPKPYAWLPLRGKLIIPLT